jgi:hypothetical protein
VCLVTLIEFHFYDPQSSFSRIAVVVVVVVLCVHLNLNCFAINLCERERASSTPSPPATHISPVKQFFVCTYLMDDERKRVRERERKARRVVEKKVSINFISPDPSRKKEEEEAE